MAAGVLALAAFAGLQNLQSQAQVLPVAPSAQTMTLPPAVPPATPIPTITPLPIGTPSGIGTMAPMPGTTVAPMPGGSVGATHAPR